MVKRLEVSSISLLFVVVGGDRLQSVGGGAVKLTEDDCLLDFFTTVVM